MCIRDRFFPDEFIAHGKPNEQNEYCEINSPHITNSILKALGLPTVENISRETA